MITVADYVISRLRQHGADVLFGVPGTSCAAVFASAARQGMTTVVNSSELDAGYAADGYARMRGLGVVSVSYGVGTLSLINAVAGALVERSPVVVVNGGPSERELWNERRYGVLFSHSTGQPSTDLALFRHVTAFASRVERPTDVPQVVDRAIATALREQRPVYLEVANDIWGSSCDTPIGQIVAERPPTGREEEIVDEIIRLIRAAVRPAILLGEELRGGLADTAERLVARTGIPWSTTLLSKSVVSEGAPGFVGVYDSDLAPDVVRRTVEGADCLLALGCTFGVDLSFLVTTRYEHILVIRDGWGRLGDSWPVPVELGRIAQLLAERWPSATRDSEASASGEQQTYKARRTWTEDSIGPELSHELMYRVVDRHLSQDWIVVHDTCLGSFPSADLTVRGRDSFVSCPVWLSIGHSLGAAVGVGMADARRPLVICGDGGFQTAAAALSAMVRTEMRAVVIVIDNGLYAIEQYLIEPRWFKEPERQPLPYVELNRWDYPALAIAMGFKYAVVANTEEALDRALAEAADWTGPGLVSVRVAARDLPPENRRGVDRATSSAAYRARTLKTSVPLRGPSDPC